MNRSGPFLLKNISPGVILKLYNVRKTSRWLRKNSRYFFHKFIFLQQKNPQNFLVLWITNKNLLLFTKERCTKPSKSLVYIIASGLDEVLKYLPIFINNKRSLNILNIQTFKTFHQADIFCFYFFNQTF